MLSKYTLVKLRSIIFTNPLLKDLRNSRIDKSIYNPRYREDSPNNCANLDQKARETFLKLWILHRDRRELIVILNNRAVWGIILLVVISKLMEIVFILATILFISSWHDLQIICITVVSAWLCWQLEIVKWIELTNFEVFLYYLVVFIISKG